jgi:hypothetical protein
MSGMSDQQRPMWIAPSRHPENRYWTVDDWKALSFTTEKDWETALEIFEDRINYRFLEAIRILQESDHEHYHNHNQRRFGFSMTALDCLLIETLAQFYKGLPESPKRKNRSFYILFLWQDSFVLKSVFDNEAKAQLFYDTIRSGILHQAETKASSTIWFWDEKQPELPFELAPDGLGLRIYWRNFHRLIVDEYHSYRECLKTNRLPGYRDNFIRKMNFICR